MPHPKRPGAFQDGGELAWIVWAVLSIFDPDEQTVHNSTALPVTTLARNLTNSTVLFTTLATNLTNSTSPVPSLATNTTVPVVFWPHNPTFPPTSLPCVPVTSPFAPFWDIFQQILATIIVSWLIPFVIRFFVDVVFVFFEPARTPTPPPTDSDRPGLLQAQNELRNELDAAKTQLTSTTDELQQTKIGLERADRELTDVKQQLLGQQSFGEEQRSRAEERGRALAASDERAQELSKANAKLSDVTKSASDNALAAKMRLREKVARHDTMATALVKEQQRGEQLERTATTHQGQARKWRQKAEEAENQIAELQSQLDVTAMQPSEVPDTFQPSTFLKDQLAEAIAARDSTGEELVAAEEQVKQLQQSQADLQDQLDQAAVAKAETEAKADALKTDKQAAEATAQSLQGRVQELEKSTSLGEEAREDVEAKLTSSQKKLADAESTVTSLQGQLGEASDVKATSESRLALADEEKSQLVVAKEKAERQRAAVSRELELAAAARKTEREKLEQEKEAALQRAAEEKRALESAKKSTDDELKAAKQELSEANAKIAELAAYKQAQEAMFASLSVTLAQVPTGDTEGQTQGTEGQAQGTEEQAQGIEGQTQGNDNVRGQGESWGQGNGDLFNDQLPPSSYDPLGPNDEPVPSNADDGSFDPAALNDLFNPASLNDEPLPPDFLSSFQGVGNDAPVGPSQAQDGFNFAEAPEPFQQGESELEKFLREWNAAHPASEQPAGPTFPSSDFTFTPPPTVPTSTVPQQEQGQPQQGGPTFPSSSFTFTPPSTVPPSTVPQQGGPSLPSFSFSFNPPSTVPTPTVAEQQGQPPQGGPIFGGINSDSAPSSTPFSADLSFFSTNAHPSTIFTGQAPPRAAGPSQDYHREITDADWAEGFAAFQRQQEASGSGNAANPPGGAEHDAGSENNPENETGDGGDGSSSESEEL